jgi:transposase-like protein/IS1 family transposase
VTCHNCRIECKKAGFFGRERIQRYQCRQCGKKFSAIPERPLDDMRVPLDKAVQIVGMLVEGMTVRGCERLTGVHRDTILRLLETVSRKCAILHDAKINHIRVNSVQLDEVCTRVRVLQRHAEHENEGDQYALTAIAKETKLILAYHVGRRNEDSAFAIMQELSDKVWGRFQLTTDGFAGYRAAAKCLLSDRVDYAQQIKTFGAPLDSFGNELRYTPRRCIGVRTKKIFGTPYDRLITTSHAERNNLNVRHFNRRFTRLTLGYSKKIMNLRFAVALFVTHYNFCRIHSALKKKSLKGKTPAMAAKLTDHQWTIEELLTTPPVDKK